MIKGFTNSVKVGETCTVCEFLQKEIRLSLFSGL